MTARLQWAVLRGRDVVSRHATRGEAETACSLENLGSDTTTYTIGRVHT